MLLKAANITVEPKTNIIAWSSIVRLRHGAAAVCDNAIYVYLGRKNCMDSGCTDYYVVGGVVCCM